MGQPRVLLISDQLPGHQVGAQLSGSASTLSRYLEHFAERSYPVTVLLLRPRLDFCIAKVAQFPYTLRGAQISRLGSLYVVLSLRNLAGAAAWALYRRLPRWITGFAIRLRDLVRRRRGFVHVLGTMPTQRDIDTARRIAREEAPTVVLYDGIFNSCELLADVPRWVITHDLKYSRAQSFRLQGYEVLPRGFTRETEIAILRDIGNIIAIQRDEAAEFKRMLPQARVIVVPTAFTASRRSRPPVVTSMQCIFVASASFHNIHGIEWFLRECWPRVIGALPKASLYIYGSVCSRLRGLPPAVIAGGVVSDEALCDAYVNAAVALVPLRIGSGLKIKAIEAFNYGVPTVMTSIGAQGLLHYTPPAFIVEDASEGFASAVIKVLTDTETQRQLHARSLQIAEEFRPRNAFREFDRAFWINKDAEVVDAT